MDEDTDDLAGPGAWAGTPQQPSGPPVPVMPSFLSRLAAARMAAPACEDDGLPF